MKTLLFFLFFSITQPVFALGIHKWVDEDGKKIYGNNPPENVLSEEVSLPEITIVAGENTYQEASQPNTEPSTEASTNTPNTPPPEQTQQKEVIKGTIEISSPKNDEAIRANDGNVTIQFAAKPDLTEGESVVIYLDGKQQNISSNLSVKLEALNRGTHSLFAVRRGANGNIVANSESIKFHVLRHSKLF